MNVEVDPEKKFDADSPVIVTGLSIKGRGSLAERPVELSPLRKISFLVGRNNHGKSTILRSVEEFWGNQAQRRLASRRSRIRIGKSDYERRILVRFTKQMLADPAESNNRSWDAICKRADTVAWAQVHDDSLFAWVHLDGIAGALVDEREIDASAWNSLLGIERSGRELATLLESAIVPFSGAFVPAFREIRPAQGSEKDAKDPDRGIGLIAELQRWQNPDKASKSHQADERRFSQLTHLLQDVLEDDSARLHIPHNLRTIQVQTRLARRYLDIDQLGDGVKQVLMIGAAALRHEKKVVCIEEPEIHLHPAMQRKLVSHLRERTNNQYLIATHSTHILDTPGASIFHVAHDSVGTVVTSSVLVDDLVRITDDLGYRPSDLLQTNYVLWVEGPADRLYYRRWLELVDPLLEENIHYVAMSYGGSLRSDFELSSGQALASAAAVPQPAQSPITQDVADILKLGRRCTLVSDSDKRGPDDPLPSTVERLMGEASTSPTVDVLVPSYVRTVENLLPGDVLQAAVQKVHVRLGKDFPVSVDEFSDPFAAFGSSKPNKVAIARAAVRSLRHVKQIRDEHYNDLREVANRIRIANGLPEISESDFEK